jgi:hypothetical protein
MSFQYVRPLPSYHHNSRTYMCLGRNPIATIVPLPFNLRLPRLKGTSD